MKPDLVVLYDGECEMCSSALRWVKRRDREDRVHPVASGSEEARRMLGERSAQPIGSLQTWEDGGRMRTGARAVATLLLRLPRWRWLGRIMVLAPVSWLLEPGYRWVARHRHRLSRRAS